MEKMMEPAIKSVLAGVAGAGGAIAIDQYAVQAPPAPVFYYGASVLAILGAYAMRKEPYVAGALGGIALGVAYRGFVRGSTDASAPPRAATQLQTADSVRVSLTRILPPRSIQDPESPEAKLFFGNIATLMNSGATLDEAFLAVKGTPLQRTTPPAATLMPPSVTLV